MKGSPNSLPAALASILRSAMSENLAYMRRRAALWRSAEIDILALPSRHMHHFIQSQTVAGSNVVPWDMALSARTKSGSEGQRHLIICPGPC